MFFIFIFRIYVLMQQKTLISRTSRPNTYESKYQNFQITKFSSFKRINKKLKKVPRKGFVYVLQIISIVWGAAL